MTGEKNLLCVLLAVLAALLPVNSSLAEEQEAQSIKEKLDAWDIEIGATLDLNGKYIWRGQNLVDYPVLQPGASLLTPESRALEPEISETARYLCSISPPAYGYARERQGTRP